MKEEKQLIILGGATGSGKTALAIKLARRYPQLVVLSADSRQVYKKLTIGSAKVGIASFDDSLTGKSEPVWAEQGVSQFLIDIAEPNTYFSLADYQKQAYRLMEACWRQGKTPLLVGGTGLYLQAVSEGYIIEGMIDKEKRVELERLTLGQLQQSLAQQGIQVPQTDWQNKRRLVRALERGHRSDPEIQKNPLADKVYSFVLDREWEEQRGLASEMVQERLDLGLINEVKTLITNEGVDKEWLYGMGLSYRLVLDMLEGRLPEVKLKDAMIHEFQQLMRRQRTWFKNRMPQAEHVSALELERRIIDELRA